MIRTPEVAAIWAALPEARIVGGAVRDQLLGQPVADVDFAVPLLPDLVMARLRDAGINVVPTGLAHGTVTAVLGRVGYEITVLRRDVAADGRHAEVAFTGDWRADAERRDFTINAMYEDSDGRIYDYFDGRADLLAGRVRFVGAAATRIEEDYLRILRFFRFFARFGRGAPDGEAVAAIGALKAGLRRLSVERVWSELKRLLAVADPRRAIEVMGETGVLSTVWPTAETARFDALVARSAPADPLLRLAALLPKRAEAFAEHYKLSLAERDKLLDLQRPMALGPDAGDAELRRALADEAAAALVARSWLVQDERPGWERLRARLEVIRAPVFPVQGRDLLALGFEAGPELGARLAEVRAWWLQGGCVADAQACLAQLRP